MNKLILIAEDTPDILVVLMELLVNEGYDVHCASDGQSAWDYLDNCIRCPDLVITDIMMPRLNGLDLIDKMKKDGRWNHLPIIIYSASPQYKKVANEKACQFLIKPFDMDDVLGTIQKCIS